MLLEHDLLHMLRVIVGVTQKTTTHAQRPGTALDVLLADQTTAHHNLTL